MTIEQFQQKQSEISNEELVGLAMNEVIQLARTGGSSHKMRVPPMVTDTDMIFCELIKRFKLYANITDTIQGDSASIAISE